MKRLEEQNPGRPAKARGAVLVALAALFICSGCAMGPNYQRPSVMVPGNFRFAGSPPPDSLGDLPWWQVFQDATLQELIRAALTNNYDLKQAVARVEQSRNAAAAAQAPFFPQISYGGDVGRSRNAELNTPIPLNGANESLAQVNLNAVWEIDLWGRLRRLSESARAQYLATDQARRGVTISLVSDVATAYFQLLQYDQELAIQRTATNAYAESYRIFAERQKRGAASKLEPDRAAAALANAAALIPQLELNVATTENQLNILLGRPPGPLARTSLTNEPPLVPEIPPGLPSELLRRRPDVLGAEQSLIAANAGVGADLANFFPQIGLTTLIGKASPALSAFTAGSANAWNVGATMTGPLFEGGQLRAQYRAAKAKFAEAGAAYQQSVLAAFQEVSNALIARQKYGEIRAWDGQSVVALTASVGLVMERYQNGSSSYYEVLETQQELYPTQHAQVQAQVGELIAVIQLYKALGGGWQVTPPITCAKVNPNSGGEEQTQ